MTGLGSRPHIWAHQDEQSTDITGTSEVDEETVSVVKQLAQFLLLERSQDLIA